VKRKDSLET